MGGAQARGSLRRGKGEIQGHDRSIAREEGGAAMSHAAPKIIFLLYVGRLGMPPRRQVGAAVDAVLSSEAGSAGAAPAATAGSAP